MGYIQLPSGSLTDFGKIVISVWYRVPAESITGGYLMTFGSPQPLYENNANFEDHSPVQVLTSVDPPTLVGEVDGCYIKYLGNGDGTFSLIFNMQLADLPTEVNTQIYASSYTPDTQNPDTLVWDHTADYGSYGFAGPTGTQNTGWNFGHYHVDIADFSSELPETSPPVLRVESPIKLAPDQWHHLLLSIDISDGLHCHGSPTPDSFATMTEGYDTTWKVWYATDDVNRAGETNLAPNFITGSSDPNAVGDPDANDIVTSLSCFPFFNNDVSQATYDSSGLIPANASAVGIPADSRYTANIKLIEMAELQIYTGVSLDTSNSTNRRAFVTADGRPETDFTIPDALLGKSPDIRVRTKSGLNLGTTGTFTKTGTINDYTPGPSLS